MYGHTHIRTYSIPIYIVLGTHTGSFDLLVYADKNSNVPTEWCVF